MMDKRVYMEGLEGLFWRRLSVVGVLRTGGGEEGCVDNKSVQISSVQKPMIDTRTTKFKIMV